MISKKECKTMATIKVPYTYVEYPFSPKATKYSKRMEKNKIGTGMFAGMATFGLLVVTVGNLDFVRDNDTVLMISALIFLVASVFSGIYAEKLRKKWYKKKILQALEEDLNKQFPNQPEVVKAQLERLGAGI